MTKYLNTKHKNIIVSDKALFDNLYESVIARDMPGMADVDSSMYVFCKEITKCNEKVILSGECSDEIFGGYPWFFREDALRSGTFPWSIAIEERQKLLNPNISLKFNLKINGY